MLNYANEVFTNVANDVRETHTGTTVIGENTRRPSKFPAVTIDEIENVVVDRLEDSSNDESFAGVTYKVQVFSNKTNGKKAKVLLEATGGGYTENYLYVTVPNAKNHTAGEIVEVLLTDSQKAVCIGEII